MNSQLPSQDSMESGEAMLLAISVVDSTTQSEVAIRPPAQAQVDALAEPNVAPQELTAADDPALSQAEIVVAGQVAADSLPFTALAKERRTFRPTDTMFNHLLKM